MTTDSGSSGHDVPRRWRVPPAPGGPATSPGPEGLAVLEELPNDSAIVLWRALRRLDTWIETHPDGRSGLFPPDALEQRISEIEAAALPGAVAEDLKEIFRRSEDADVEGHVLAGCTERVGEWVRMEGHPRAAAEFLQTAANLSPDDPAYALAAGRAVRDFADYPRAEAWLERAVSLARLRQDWGTYVSTFLAIGVMMRRRGNIPKARRSVSRALRRARREHQREFEAKALHDLFVIEFESERFDQAQEYASMAVTTYPPKHPNLIRLFHSLTYFWIARGQFAPALQVFRELQPYVSEEEEPYLLGGMALAAGGSKNEGLFEYARARLSAFRPAAGVAEAWLEVATGAAQLQRHDEALSAAHHALELARQRGEQKIRFRAEGAIDELREAARSDPAPDHPPQTQATTELVARIIQALQPA